MTHSSRNSDVPSEEDAFNFIVERLGRKEVRYKAYDLWLVHLMDEFVEKYLGIHQGKADHFPRISPPFYAAAWTLCRRGILRPGMRRFDVDRQLDEFSINGYSLTPFGKQWISEASGRFDYVPMEPGRFAKLLDRFHERFGNAFRDRAQEAVRCYGAHAYLACCAMCGAAAEAIVLASAVAKLGDKDSIHREYMASGGRVKVERRLLGDQPENVRKEVSSFLSLLKYWRDLSSHGREASFDDNEAFTSLALLLRFAQYMTDRWDDFISTKCGSLSPSGGCGTGAEDEVKHTRRTEHRP